jgi:hypothetical protein
VFREHAQVDSDERGWRVYRRPFALATLQVANHSKMPVSLELSPQAPFSFYDDLLKQEKLSMTINATTVLFVRYYPRALVNASGTFAMKSSIEEESIHVQYTFKVTLSAVELEPHGAISLGSVARPPANHSMERQGTFLVRNVGSNPVDVTVPLDQLEGRRGGQGIAEHFTVELRDDTAMKLSTFTVPGSNMQEYQRYMHHVHLAPRPQEAFKRVTVSVTISERAPAGPFCVEASSLAVCAARRLTHRMMGWATQIPLQCSGVYALDEDEHIVETPLSIFVVGEVLDRDDINVPLPFIAPPFHGIMQQLPDSVAPLLLPGDIDPKAQNAIMLPLLCCTTTAFGYDVTSEMIQRCLTVDNYEWLRHLGFGEDTVADIKRRLVNLPSIMSLRAARVFLAYRKKDANVLAFVAMAHICGCDAVRRGGAGRAVKRRVA